MTDFALERGHEVYLVHDNKPRLSVRLQPAWALAPGGRFENATRWSATRTETLDTATSAVGIVGTGVSGALWMVATSCRWAFYHLRRRQNWTVTLSSYEARRLELPGRREPVVGRRVQTLESWRHADLASALDAAKARASALVLDGYRTARPVGWDDR